VSTVRHGSLPGNHGAIHYWIVGEDAADTAGPPLLVIHGGPGMAHNYLRDLDPLGENRAVVYYDQTGCGLSDRPADPTLWTLGTFVDEVDTVRDALSLDRVHLLGQSFGGWIALEYALRQPAGLASLILANTCASIPLLQTEVARLIDALPDGAISAAQRFNTRHVLGTDAMPDHFRQAAQNINGAIYDAMMGAEWSFSGSLAGWDVTDRLGELHLPTLVLSGRDDEMTPDAVRPMVEAIPGATWMIFEDSAHLPMVTETAAFLTAVGEFLGRADSADQAKARRPNDSSSRTSGSSNDVASSFSIRRTR
jgi:L-proline amide hydrolase